MADAAGVTIRYADRPTLASIVVPLVVGALGVALAVIRYRRAEITTAPASHLLRSTSVSTTIASRQERMTITISATYQE